MEKKRVVVSLVLSSSLVSELRGVVVTEFSLLAPCLSLSCDWEWFLPLLFGIVPFSCHVCLSLHACVFLAARVLVTPINPSSPSLILFVLVLFVWARPTLFFFLSFSLIFFLYCKLGFAHFFLLFMLFYMP